MTKKTDQTTKEVLETKERMDFEYEVMSELRNYVFFKKLPIEIRRILTKFISEIITKTLQQFETQPSQTTEKVLESFDEEFHILPIGVDCTFEVSSKKIKNFLTKKLQQKDKEIEEVREEERIKVIRIMQHQARNVLKSTEAVAEWGDIYLKTNK